MIFNGYYINFKKSPSSTHETEIYFTLSQTQTLYFVYYGATITFDDETPIITESTEPAMTSSNWSSYPGISHTFTAGAHKIYIDSTDPSVPYFAAKESTDDGTYKKQVRSVYDTRLIAGRQTYQTNYNAMFYLANNYFTGTITFVGKAPCYFFNKSALGYYQGSNQYQAKYANWSTTLPIDITECSKIGTYFFRGWAPFEPTITNIDIAFDNLEEIEEGGLKDLFYNNAEFANLNFPKLKIIGNQGLNAYNVSLTNPPSQSYEWSFPVLEEIGDYCFRNAYLFKDGGLNFPAIKKIGSSCFESRTFKVSGGFVGCGTIYLGPNITSIGSDCFRTPEDYYGYSPYWRNYNKVYISAKTPPTTSAYSFCRYKGSRQYAYDGNSIYVPSSAVSRYKSGTYWKNFSSYIYAQ